MHTPETFRTRRALLLKEAGNGLILLPGNEEAPMNYADNVYRFRQDSSFLYFTGIRLPHFVLLLDASSGTSVLFGQEPTIDDIVWMGPQPSLAQLAEAAGIEKALPYEALSGHIASALAQGRTVHYLPPYRGEQVIQLSRWLGRSVDDITKGASPALIQAVVRQRMTKTSAEIEEIGHAVEVTGQMHVAAMRQAREGMTEAQLAGLVEGIAVAGGGNLSYPVILTVNGHVLHNHEHHNVLRNGQMVLGDFGAETANGYAGDITRTFPVSGRFTAQQRDIYEIVLNTETDAIAACRPGVGYREIHLKAALQIANGLKDLGLMQGDMAEAVAQGAHALFFPHGLGHALGLDVHDMEGLGEQYVGYRPGLERSKQFGLKSLRLARELEPGFVLTVEPGIYFIPQLIDIWQKEGRAKDFIRYDKLEAFRNFTGIRIEDNIVITAEGCRVLGTPIPKKPEEIEAMRAAG
jgi:Xaa-Pro aminopeptidase